MSANRNIPLAFNSRRDNALLREAVYRVLETSTQPMTVKDIHQKVMRLGSRQKVRYAVEHLRQGGRIEVAQKIIGWEGASTYRVARMEAANG